MYKNQLQELAQRSCFNLPSYTSFREGPDHAPRFKAAVNFNGESFESPSYCSTLRQAEHSAAEVALNSLASRGPSNSLAARVLDETGVYKNLLQEVSQRVGASLPVYTTFRTGQGHLPVFTGTVELAGVIFTGEPAKNKKQAEKNAAMASWLSLKSLVQQCESSMPQKPHKDEQEHVTVARALQKYLMKARLAGLLFPIRFPTPKPRPTTQPSPATTSKILPLICPKSSPHNRPLTPVRNNPIYQKITKPTQNQPITNTVANETLLSLLDNLNVRPHKFPAAGAAPYIPVRHCNPHHRMAPPVKIRNAVPVFSAPPLPRPPALGMAQPVCARQQAVPVFAPTHVHVENPPMLHPSVKKEDPRFPIFAPVRAEKPPVTRVAPGRYDESLFPKFVGSKILPVFAAPNSEARSSEITLVQIKSPVSETSGPSSSSSVASEKETKIDVHEMRQESEAEVEGKKI